MTMIDLLAIVILASTVLLPLALLRARRPLHSLFNTPESATMRRLFVAVGIAQAIAGAVWLAADVRLLGTPIHLLTAWGFVIYFWIRVAQLLRDNQITPPPLR